MASSNKKASKQKADGDDRVAVTLTLLDKEYRVACPEGEQDGLKEAARMLDARMREIREGSRIIGADRLAVISALNLVHELNQGMQQAKENSSGDNARMRGFLERLDEKVTDAVAG